MTEEITNEVAEVKEESNICFNPELLTLTRPDKDTMILDIKNFIPRAFIIGVGNKQTVYLNYLNKKVIENDNRVIQQMCTIVRELIQRGKLTIQCRCGCKNKHAIAFKEALIINAEAIDLYFKAGNLVNNNTGKTYTTFEDLGLSQEEIASIKQQIEDHSGQENVITNGQL